MLKTVKSLRKLFNVNLLFVSSDQDMQSHLTSDFEEYFEDLVLVHNEQDAINALIDTSFDMIVIDTNISDDFAKSCEKISECNPSIPKIIISVDEDHQSLVSAVNCGAYTYMSKPLNLKDLRLAIIMCLNQTKRGDKIEFQNGIYFDEYRDQFFKPGGNLIDFTKLEKGFLKLLIARRGEITDYDTIKEVVWKGKNMSIYTMRNIVNKIRQKTYYGIVKNHSNKGYVLEDQVK